MYICESNGESEIYFAAYYCRLNIIAIYFNPHRGNTGYAA